MKTQIQHIEHLDKTNNEQNAIIETQKQLLTSKHIGSRNDNDTPFGQPLFENPFAGGGLFGMASENPFARARTFDAAAKNLRANHEARLDHLPKEPNTQPVVQSIFGPSPLRQERPAKLTEERSCSNCRILETQRMEDKTLIQRLHHEIAELEAIKDPEAICIDQKGIKRLTEMLENNDAELRDSYEAAFRAMFEGKQQEDKDTIARLRSRIADLEANNERISDVHNTLRAVLDRLTERLDTEPEQVVMRPHEDLNARLQQKMEKLDAALGRLSAAEDEEVEKPATLFDSEQEATTEKRKEGRCIVS